VIQKLKKPAIAYKILAAGRLVLRSEGKLRLLRRVALPAREGFAYALGRIAAKDGICVGVFPKDRPNQVREDCELAMELSKRA